MQFEVDNCTYEEEKHIILRGKRIYSFLDKIDVKGESYFYLKYNSQLSHELIVNDKVYVIPASDETIVYLIKLESLFYLDYFTIHLNEKATENDVFVESGLLSKSQTYNSFDDQNILFNVGNTIILKTTYLEHLDILELNLLSIENAKSENISITLSDSLDVENTAKYSMRTLKGENHYRFYANQSEHNFNTVDIVGRDYILKEINFKSMDNKEVALPVDLEEFIYWKNNTWRDWSYEIFSWDLFPQMLLIDTVSYKIQSLFFKRLAFFTEKKYSAGTLLEDYELESLHGWNAHDYRAEDLARFFNLVLRENFNLNEYEVLLKSILINNGVLENDGEYVRPLKGGILSISRESSDKLRWLFLSHECYHGVFFSSEEYIESVYQIWNKNSEEEKDFWRIFLDLYGYNVEDEFLLVNEFQAYLMQQKISDSEAYFKSKINWMISIRPYLRVKMEHLLNSYGDTFSRNAQLVEDAAHSLTGIRAGDLVLKRKK